MEKPEYYIVYRVESKVDHHGPWSSEWGLSVDIMDGAFTISGNDSDLSKFIHKFANCYETEDYPAQLDDFEKSLIEEIQDEDIDYRICLHIPCLFFYWFGFDIDLILKNFNLYKVKVKDFKISKSGKQAIYKKEDEISSEILLTFKNI